MLPLSSEVNIQRYSEAKTRCGRLATAKHMNRRLFQSDQVAFNRYYQEIFVSLDLVNMRISISRRFQHLIRNLSRSSSLLVLVYVSAFFHPVQSQLH